MSLTTSEQILNRLDQAFDRSHFDRIFNLHLLAFNREEASQLTKTGGGRWPDYPSIRPDEKEVGASNRIFNAQFTTCSRIMRSLPEPEFKQVDRVTAEVRKQFWLTRGGGTGYESSEWLGHLTRAFLDGDGFGEGLVQIGSETNPKTGKRFVTLKHVPTLQFYYDNNARSLNDARWIVFLDYLPYDLAVDMFGEEVASTYRLNLQVYGTESTMECVRFFEYFDIGFGKKGKPTYAILLGDIDNEPYKVQENEFGCLPFAHYEHILLPHERRPSGRIIQLLSSQEAMNETEIRMREEVRKPTIDIVSAEHFDQKDMESYHAGEPNTCLRLNKILDKENGAPFIRIPGGEISQTTMHWYQQQQREFIAQSGVTELDMGQSVSGANTLGETQLVDQRSRSQGNWSISQSIRFFVRLVDKVMKIAAKVDDDPVMLDIFGNNIILNVADRDELSIAKWLEEPAKIVISEEAVTKRDDQVERAIRLQELMSIQDLVMAGIVPLEWWAQRRLEVMGFDAKDAMTKGPQEAGVNPQGQQGQQQAPMAQGQAPMAPQQPIQQGQGPVGVNP